MTVKSERFGENKHLEKKYSILRMVRNLLGIFFAFSLFAVSVVFVRYAWLRSYNERMKRLVILMPSETAAENIDLDNSSDFAKTAYLPTVDFNALKNINENCVGWIYACDGKISYPIVASDDDYYLNHSVDGKKSRAGTIFVDSNYENPFAENRAVIYGHNMKDGSMFHPLMQYWQNNEYLSENPNIYIMTENVTYIYQITSAYVVEYKDIDFTISSVENSQKIIDLVTCEYSGEDTRLVVEAKQIEK